MARAVAWAVTAFHNAGVATHTESYKQTLTWREGATRLEILGSTQFPISLAAEGWSASTPSDGIEAELVSVGDGSETDFAQKTQRTRGAILLVNSNITETWADLFNEYDRTPAIIKQATDSGARAILWSSARARRLLYRHTDTLKGELSNLPMAIVAREDALRLARLSAHATTPLRVRFVMPNSIDGPIEAHNVVGEIRGRELPDEVVILGAHLDSWDLGTGALDNGCNAAMLIAAARTLKESGVHPRRTIRFVLFSGEEQGMLGSRAYVTQHQVELDRIRAMLVFDAGDGQITGYQLSGRPDLKAGLQEALKPLSGFDVDHPTLDGDLGSDNVDFMLQGIPTLIAAQEPASYMQNYHAASDTYDKVNIRQLRLNLAIAAVTAYEIANLAQPLGVRQSRKEIEDVLARTGFDKQMKTEGLWAEWAAGTRGRFP